MIGIYKITNKINGKSYIGQSIDIDRRIKEHIRGLNKGYGHNPYFQYAWDKYGENNFEISILEEIDNVNYLDEKEIYYISKYKSNDRNYGYNITAGGNNLAINDEYRNTLSIRSRFNNSDLTESDIRQIKLCLYCLMDRKEISKLFNISEKSITQLARGKSYSYINPELNESIHNLKQKLIDERNLNILKLFDDGLKIAEIVKKTELSVSIVEKCIYKYRNNKVKENKDKYKHIYDEVYRLNSQGINNYQISKILKISPSTVQRYLTKENNPYKELPFKKVTSKIENEIIDFYYNKNKTVNEIATILDITDTTVRDYINKYKYANTEVR